MEKIIMLEHLMENHAIKLDVFINKNKNRECFYGVIYNNGIDFVTDIYEEEVNIDTLNKEEIVDSSIGKVKTIKTESFFDGIRHILSYFFNIPINQIKRKSFGVRVVTDYTEVKDLIG